MTAIFRSIAALPIVYCAIFFIWLSINLAFSG